MRCQACRRPLTNPASIKHGLGPDCLRRAVKAGTAPLDALEWLLGERGEFEPSDAHLPQPEGYKRPQFWWRGEFRKRAGL